MDQDAFVKKQKCFKHVHVYLSLTQKHTPSRKIIKVPNILAIVPDKNQCTHSKKHTGVFTSAAD